ncbi:type II secretion system F family protein, partial [Aquabacterium sp. A08]|nr:type II secretion system F family protein [Aquabacterium sp. A08]
QRRQAQSTELQIDRALEWKTSAATPAAPPEFTPARSRLERVLQDLLRSSFGKALLAEEDLTLLEQAGWDDERHRAYYVGTRVGGAALLTLLALSLEHSAPIRELMAGFLGFATGLLLPKWVLRARAKTRHAQLHKEIPLLVDLLRLLQGTGMSLDMSLRVTASDFQDILPVLARELDIANRQYAAGRSRADSLRRLTRLYG